MLFFSVFSSERSITVDDGASSVKIVTEDAFAEGMRVRFTVTARHSSNNRAYETTPAKILSLLDRLRRGEKLPPCGSQQIMGKLVP